MQPVVVMPDAERAVLDFLRPELAARGETAAVGNKVPPTVPAKFVRIRRVGGTMDGPVYDRPRIDVQVWHGTDFERMALAQLVRALLHAGFTNTTDFLGPTQMPDPADSSKTVVMFTVEFVLRGTAG